VDTANLGSDKKRQSAIISVPLATVTPDCSITEYVLSVGDVCQLTNRLSSA